MRIDIRSSTSSKALAASSAPPTLSEAMGEVRLSVDRFCLLAGIEALQEMMAEDAAALCGPRHARSPARRGHRWGTTQSEISYHGARSRSLGLECAILRAKSCACRAGTHSRTLSCSRPGP